MSDYLEFDPAVADKRQVYRLLTGSVVPRPIGWASTVNKKGITNLAPFSFFTVVCVVPPMISLTIARNPDGSEKHTLKNVRETGEFCFNVVTHPVWKEMVDSANAFPEDDSEFAETGLTPIPSVKIAAPRVKEVPIHFECKLHRVIELGPNRHPLVIGEVVYMHVDPALHDRRLYRHEEARSDRAAQRLFLCDARRDFRAQVRRRPAAMNPFDAVVTAAVILGVVLGFMSGCCAAWRQSLAISSPRRLPLRLRPRIVPLRRATRHCPGQCVAAAVSISRAGVDLGALFRNGVDEFIDAMSALFDRVAGAVLGAVRILLVAVLIVVVFDRIIPADRQPPFCSARSCGPICQRAGQKGLQSHCRPTSTRYIDRLKRERGL